VAWTVYGQGKDLRLCQRFAALKNARDASADDLLGPALTVSPQPVTPEEAARLNADAFLRADLVVQDVRADDDAHRFILVMKGSATGEPLRIRSGDQVDRVQQMVTNPELIVEVREGKIYPLSARSAAP
jgi:hypothetical protein